MRNNEKMIATSSPHGRKGPQHHHRLVTATSSPHGRKGLLITQEEGAIDERLYHQDKFIHKFN